MGLKHLWDGHIKMSWRQPLGSEMELCAGGWLGEEGPRVNPSVLASILPTGQLPA